MVYHIFFVPLKKKTTMSSPYNGLNVEDWKSKTEELIKAHPLKEKIVPIVLKAWDDIFNSPQIRNYAPNMIQKRK